MTRRVKYAAEDNKFLGGRKISVMQALETAVLLMEQSGVTEEDIMKYVHMIHMGWIRDVRIVDSMPSSERGQGGFGSTGR